jgi:arylsulfatase A-like enzyme
VVGSFKLGGEGAPAWQPVSLPLGDVATLAAVELIAKSSTKGARVVFAEPRVVAGAPPSGSPGPPSRGVILVVLGAVAPASLAPTASPELAQLAATGTVFDAHRASTSFASGALASMLTGLLPRAHGVSDPEAALGGAAVTVAEAARQAGVVTGMFTANPTTSATYGFARGWETFTARPPTDDAAATAVFDDLERWLEAHKQERFLAVVHARGGHPPWDAPGDDKDLAPPGYAGSLDPKHAGEMLAKVRRSGSPKLFTDADRQRAFALHDRALLAHDAALGRLLAKVRQLGRDGDTTFIVTGDVGVDAAAHTPFLEDDALDEGTLAIPLVVRGPGPAVRARVAAATSSLDVARTMLDALGLPPPPQMRGESLRSVAERPERPGLATSSARFSARWSAFVLSGLREREGKLCNLALEPACVSDVRATFPIAAELLHALAFDEMALSSATAAPSVTHPVPDAPTSAALRAWGVTAPSTTAR